MRSSGASSFVGALLGAIAILGLTSRQAAAYTDEEAARGRVAFGQCASCHIVDGYPLHPNPVRTRELTGWTGRENLRALGEAPGRTGTLADVTDFILLRMPLTAPGSLKERDVLDVTAWILKSNDVPPDQVPISNETLQQMTLNDAFPMIRFRRIAPWLAGFVVVCVAVVVFRARRRSKQGGRSRPGWEAGSGRG